MQINNINRLLIFAGDGTGRVLTLEELSAKYGVSPAGTNFYYGINQANVDSSGINTDNPTTALNPTHQAFFNAFLKSLQQSPDDEKTVVLGVEPPDQAQPYQFVASNLPLVQLLASDLNALQNQALAAGKRLNIIIRYASEMNDGGQSQGHDPTGYTSTFVQVRQIFSAAAPKILFSFSPALRADLPESLITQYWPGDENVDIIGGTWYIGAPDQTNASTANMRAYFLHRIGAGKTFGISEFGGSDAAGLHNDLVLQPMLHDLEAMQLQGISFQYGTIFLGGKFGSDATLKFLST